MGANRIRQRELSLVRSESWCQRGHVKHAGNQTWRRHNAEPGVRHRADRTDNHLRLKGDVQRYAFGSLARNYEGSGGRGLSRPDSRDLVTRHLLLCAPLAVRGPKRNAATLVEPTMDFSLDGGFDSPLPPPFGSGALTVAARSTPSGRVRLACCSLRSVARQINPDPAFRHRRAGVSRGPGFLGPGPTGFTERMT